jgi:uncharacterized protein
MYPFQDHPSISILPEGGVLLASTLTLIVADVHLGKAAVFRSRGLPVPEGDTERDLLRLVTLVRNHHARHLVIAGDLFHAQAGITSGLRTALTSFLNELEIPVTLVVGNHDAKISGLPAGLECVPHLDLETIRIVHDPAHASGGQLHISGHLHPVVKIPDGKRTWLRLPCFLFRDQTLVLPAFGSFTGGAVLSPAAGDRIFAAVREQMVEIPLVLWGV